MEINKNLTKPAVDIQYYRLLENIDLNYLTRILGRGGTNSHVGVLSAWYQILDTDICVEAVKENDRYYAKSFGYMPGSQDSNLTNGIENMNFGGAGKKTGSGRKSSSSSKEGKKTTRTKSQSRKGYKSPSMKEHESDQEKNSLYNVDYSDVDYFGGEKKGSKQSSKTKALALNKDQTKSNTKPKTISRRGGCLKPNAFVNIHEQGGSTNHSDEQGGAYYNSDDDYSTHEDDSSNRGRGKGSSKKDNSRSNSRGRQTNTSGRGRPKDSGRNPSRSSSNGRKSSRQ